MSTKNLNRCEWAGNSPIYIKYHDEEWGVPVYEDQKHFEFLILEGAQAGLSWITILKRRAGYRRVFHEFDPAKVAQMTEKDVETALSDTGIIRNKLKVHSTVNNAKVFLEIQKEFGSFSDYVWNFVDGKVIDNQWEDASDVPATSVESDSLSEDLKKRGMSFVGSTIVYAHMQATGLVNDHIISCFRHNPIN
jgi:DNA-3-methyladenine glycosylase I